MAEYIQDIIGEVATGIFKILIESTHGDIDGWLADELAEAGATEEELEHMAREQLLDRYTNVFDERPRISPKFEEFLRKNVDRASDEDWKLGDVVDRLGLKTAIFDMGELIDWEGWPEEGE